MVVEKKGQVATIRMRAAARLSAAELGRSDSHWELADILDDLRGDNSVRVVVLTGADDGLFAAAPRTDVYASLAGKRRRSDTAKAWRTFTGVIRCHETIAAMEKPVVARVNGDAIGFGSSLVFASDIIVAREDARIADMHLGMGEVKPVGPPFGIVPGDGGVSLIPLYMPPPLAKEYLMLAKEYTAKELAQRGLINYAVPADQLDAVVEDIVARLLKRSAYALAWTKRIANRHVVDQLNRTLDAGAAYEMVNFLQIEQLGGHDKKTLD
jgi:enoyl-CoA hydratase/carnithine racemase